MSIIVNGTTLGNVDVGGANIQKVYARQGETGTYVLVFEKGGTVTVALWFGGNWKMNKVKSEIDTFFETFNSTLELNETKKVVIFPPACYLDYTKSKISSALSDMVEIGAQNISYKEKGAYTGQISAQQAVDCGCSWIMVGNSEVREYLGVTAEQMIDQINIALNNSLKICFCIGEPVEEYEAGTSTTYLNNQMEEVLEQNGEARYSMDEIMNFVICYEPVWAIGTGKSMSPETVQPQLSFIKQKIANWYGLETAENIPVVLGGIVKPANIQEYMAMPNTNGALAAGSSLKAADFATMVNIV